MSLLTRYREGRSISTSCRAAVGGEEGSVELGVGRGAAPAGDAVADAAPSGGHGQILGVGRLIAHTTTVHGPVLESVTVAVAIAASVRFFLAGA
jgi:ribosomal protein S5